MAKKIAQQFRGNDCYGWTLPIRKFVDGFEIDSFILSARPLGAGGFGSASFALQNSDELEVCLKVVPLNNGVYEHEIERKRTYCPN